jgi:methylmalonyl-CoA mutase
LQEIEAAGGAGAAIPQGLLQRQVAKTRAEREKNVACRKDALTGVSDYPNLDEVPVKVLDVPRRPAPLEKASFEGLPTLRLSEPFEALRHKSDAMLAKNGARPKVFLANLGRMSDFTVRATFAKNFYEAGGIEAPSNDGFKDQAEMIAAFKASGTNLACLCSSDKVYETEAAEAAKALSEAGAVVQLAGRPGEREETWRNAGVAGFVHAGCDMLVTLRAAQDILKVAP